MKRLHDFELSDPRASAYAAADVVAVGGDKEQDVILHLYQKDGAGTEVEVQLLVSRDVENCGICEILNPLLHRIGAAMRNADDLRRRAGDVALNALVARELLGTRGAIVFFLCFALHRRSVS